MVAQAHRASKNGVACGSGQRGDSPQSVRAQFPQIHAWLAASYAQAGQDEDAQVAATNYVNAAKSELAMTGTQEPGAWSKFFAEPFPFKQREDLDHFLDGLGKAGLPM